MKKILKKLNLDPRIEKFVLNNGDLIKKIGIVLIIAVLGIAIYSIRNNHKEQKLHIDDVKNVKNEVLLVVDICGEVNNPTVLKLEDGSRISDAIDKAGGVTENANLVEINRAELVIDGQKIVIPSKTPEEGDSNGGTDEDFSDGRININTADASELEEITGVGEVTAQKIIDYRKENGSFKTVEDLKQVSGIGDKTFEKLKKEIKV